MPFDQQIEAQDRNGNVRYPGVGKLFLFWAAIGVLTELRYQFSWGSYGHGREAIATFLGCTAWYFPWALLSPLVFHIERRLPLGSAGWPGRVALLAAISLPFCAAASVVMMGLYAITMYAFNAHLWSPTSAPFWLGAFPAAEAVFWGSVAGGYFFRTLFRLQEQERKSARWALEKSQLEASLNQAQLEALRAKLNPHFLFNSLQNISMLALEEPKTASSMLTVLGDLLRAVLRRDSQPETTLSEEIELTKSYVALEQMRFGDRLRVTFDIADGARSAIVPSFLMQPLLENAIVHGLRGTQKQGIIQVRAIQEGDVLLITVNDNGLGPPADTEALKVGVGLGSTCERLARMYPDQHTFSIRKPPEGGAEVRITLPLQFAPAR